MEAAGFSLFSMPPGNGHLWLHAPTSPTQQDPQSNAKEHWAPQKLLVRCTAALSKPGNSPSNPIGATCRPACQSRCDLGSFPHAVLTSKNKGAVRGAGLGRNSSALELPAPAESALRWHSICSENAGPVFARWKIGGSQQQYRDSGTKFNRVRLKAKRAGRLTLKKINSGLKMEECKHGTVLPSSQILYIAQGPKSAQNACSGCSCHIPAAKLAGTSTEDQAPRLQSTL